MRSAIVVLAPFLMAAAAPAPAAVTYTITPVFSGKALKAVAVTMHLAATSTGRTRLRLPDAFGGVTRHWKYLSSISLQGGTLTAPAAAEREIRSAPNGQLTLRYTVSSAYQRDPDAAGGNAYDGAAIRPDWFSSLGEFLFVIPVDRETDPSSITFANWPSSWITASTTKGHLSTVADVEESSVIAGRNLEMRARPIKGGTLHFISHGSFDWSIDDYANRVAAVISAERTFWNEADGDYMVTFLRLAPSAGVSSTGGTGRSHGFVQYASPDSPANVLFRTIAHEYAHNWIPHEVGEVPDEPASAAGLFWFTEGFADFYASRLLLRSGLWTPEQFVDELNRTLFRLTSSPARVYPNERITKDFWTDPSVEQLPYDRGRLFAFLLDYKLRQAGNAGLDQVLFAMRDRWMAARSSAKPALMTNLLAVLDAQGFDARPMIERYITRGEPIELPSDLFGSCARVVTTAVPVFDPGFDARASVKAGSFQGVDPDGPAYAAGLRNGMIRLARLSNDQDSRVPLTFRVRNGNSERTLSWLPAGKQRIGIQEVRLASPFPSTAAAGAATAHSEMCIKLR